MSTLQISTLFFTEIIALFFLSRRALTLAYIPLKKILKSNTLVISFIALLYLPGTIIHELSHYIVALILNMHPSEIRILPVIEKDRVKLGHVLYEKHRHDFIRGTIVGIAPFFGGLTVLWLIIQSGMFPGTTYWHTLGFGYLILTLSANMFSSKQDLVDAGYVLPVIFMLGLLWYVFIPIHITIPLLPDILPSLIYFLYTLQTPLLFSVGIHLLLIVLLHIKT